MIAAERMVERERRKEEQLSDIMNDVDDDVGPAPLPMVLRELREISSMYGESDDKPTSADTYGLRMWPRFDSTRNCRHVWRRCLQLSPKLLTRFAATDPLELRKFFNVGLLLEENMENLLPPQALILGYVID